MNENKSQPIDNKESKIKSKKRKTVKNSPTIHQFFDPTQNGMIIPDGDVEITV